MNGVCHRTPQRSPRTAATLRRSGRRRLVLAHPRNANFAHARLCLHVSMLLSSPPNVLTPSHRGAKAPARAMEKFRSRWTNSSRDAIVLLQPRLEPDQGRGRRCCVAGCGVRHNGKKRRRGYRTQARHRLRRRVGTQAKVQTAAALGGLLLHPKIRFLYRRVA